MNDEKKYTVIMPFIGHPSITFKKSLTKNIKSINKKCCTIFKTFKNIEKKKHIFSDENVLRNKEVLLEY